MMIEKNFDRMQRFEIEEIFTVGSFLTEETPP